MKKVTASRFFLKSFVDLLGGQITAREVLIYGIVANFEANGLPCFVSRQELANRINESEATAERSVQLLIKEGWLIATRDGRKRRLKTVCPKERDLYQNRGSICIKIEV